MQTKQYYNRWYRREMLFNQSLPIKMVPWLFNVSSLTKRLLQRCPHSFSVELLSQNIRKPLMDESCVLKIAHGKSALIREVLLHCNNQAVVYARTVIPLTTLTGSEVSYANLGNRPLGAMLFADRTMRRDVVEVSLLSPGDVLYKNTGCKKETVWGRRSIFRVGGKPLLVSEFFLPALLSP